MNKIPLMLMICLIVSGCSKVSHLDQLLTLKDLADEQEQMGKQIQAQDQKFEMMLDEMKAGTLNQYANKSKISRAFGGPIYMKTVQQDDHWRDVWLYRYAGKFFGSEKIYLYFDADDNLVGSEYFGGSNG